jgi:hypothetical protein
MPDLKAVHNGDYEEGMRDGRLQSLERRVDRHDSVLESHEKRLLYLERIAFGMLAILAFTSVWPKVAHFLNAFPAQ